DWSKLLAVDKRRDIPLCFGLIGLQCLAATMAEEDGIWEKFRLLTNISDDTRLNVCLKEKVSPLDRNVLDVIWERVKSYLKKRDLHIELPKERDGPHRYVRYPKSQVVLNRDDLKEYKPFFESLRESL